MSINNMPDSKVSKHLNSYIEYGFDSYISKFQDLYDKSPLKYKKSFQKLLNNLDTESINHINHFNNLMLSLPLPSYNFLVKESFLIKDFEKKILSANDLFIESKNDLYKKYSLQGYEKLEANVFVHFCGIKAIEKDYQKKYGHSIKHHLKSNIYIDAGAFWGDSLLAIKERYQPAEAICFEPNTINRNLLGNTISSNSINNTKVYDYGLYNKKSTLKMSYISNTQNHGASVVFVPKKPKEEIINTTSLDSIILAEHNAKTVGLIKADVEGLGLEVIKGSKKIIKKYKPILSIAIYHNPEEMLLIKPFLEKLNPQYSFKILNLHPRFPLKETTLVAY